MSSDPRGLDDAGHCPVHAGPVSHIQLCRADLGSGLLQFGGDLLQPFGVAIGQDH